MATKSDFENILKELNDCRDRLGNIMTRYRLLNGLVKDEVWSELVKADSSMFFAIKKIKEVHGID